MGKGWSEEREEDELRVPARSLTGGQVGVRGTVIKKRRGRQVKRVWRQGEGQGRAGHGNKTDWEECGKVGLVLACMRECKSETHHRHNHHKEKDHQKKRRKE